MPIEGVKLLAIVRRIISNQYGSTVYLKITNCLLYVNSIIHVQKYETIHSCKIDLFNNKVIKSFINLIK